MSATKKTPSASDAAKLMHDKFESDGGYLAQQDAAWEIENQFGEPFVYTNDNGNLAIARSVLAEFRKLTPDAVWDKQDKSWRRRDAGDDPSKRQAD